MVLAELGKKSKKKNKKKKKSKKRKSKLRRQREASSGDEDESSDSFDDDFNNAVLDTNLDTAADRQLKQLAEMQQELLDLQKTDNSDAKGSGTEGEEDQQYLPPSNQEVVTTVNNEVFNIFF